MNHHDLSLPHHRLHVWELSLSLIRLVHAVEIADAECRAEARSSAKSCARNIAEAAGRRSGADKRRVFSIARGEVGECVAAVETARAIGACAEAGAQSVVTLGSRISAMLWRLG
jgi:four helix bundle protein